MNIENIAVGIKDAHGLDMSDESAITLLRHALSKLTEQAGDEPVARIMVWVGDDDFYNTGRVVARTFEECKENAYPDSWAEGEKLYTEAQLIAAQQRTAKACAKLAVDFYPAPGEDVRAGISRVITVGEWRDYQ